MDFNLAVVVLQPILINNKLIHYGLLFSLKTKMKFHHLIMTSQIEIPRLHQSITVSNHFKNNPEGSSNTTSNVHLIQSPECSFHTNSPERLGLKSFGSQSFVDSRRKSGTLKKNQESGMRPSKKSGIRNMGPPDTPPHTSTESIR